MGQLKRVIDDCLSDPQYAQGRSAVKSETWEHCGEGAVRVVDYLLGKYDELMNEREMK